MIDNDWIMTMDNDSIVGRLAGEGGREGGGVRARRPVAEAEVGVAEAVADALHHHVAVARHRVQARGQVRLGGAGGGG